MRRFRQLAKSMRENGASFRMFCFENTTMSRMRA
jgi:hypothetical protein